MAREGMMGDREPKRKAGMGKKGRTKGSKRMKVYKRGDGEKKKSKSEVGVSRAHRLPGSLTPLPYLL